MERSFLNAERTGNSIDVPQLTVVTNREPYSHHYTPDGITRQKSRGGLVTALESAMEAVGGDWVAWGSGSADFDPAVLSDGMEARSPPGEDSYTLRRVELGEADVRSYYYGYSNQVLWPLFHLHTGRVRAEPGFWEGYRTVNERFAEVLRDRGATDVWFHDYHFLLAPGMVREAADEPVRLSQFVHIPWPPAEVFEICPHGTALLRGVLGNDRIGFQRPADRQNFLDCVADSLDDARVRDTTVRYRGHTTRTFAQPVGISPASIHEAATGRDDDYWEFITNRFDVDTDSVVALGIERMDYSKGILRRLDALEQVFETTSLQGQFQYIQKTLDSRTQIEQYRQYGNRVRERIHEINREFGTEEWTPIVHIEADISYRDILDLYRNADICLVTSTKDGLNLVAQEFVAASRGTRSRLVLSRFAGSADLLDPHATIVNPYDIQAVSEAIADEVAAVADGEPSQMDELYRILSENSVEEWLEQNLSAFARHSSAL